MGLFYFESYQDLPVLSRKKQDKKRQGMKPEASKTRGFCCLIVRLLFMLPVGSFCFYFSFAS